MKKVEALSIDMVTRASAYGKKPEISFDANSLGAVLFTKLSAAVTDLNQTGGQQVAGKETSMSGTRMKVLLYETLYAELHQFSETAHSIEFDLPGTAIKFHVPHHPTNQNLVNTARAFATAALPLKAQFIAHAMPATFLDTLNANITAFSQAAGVQAGGTDQQVGATAHIGDVLGEALITVRRLTPIIKNKYGSNRALWAEWQTASHIERAPQHAKPAAKTA
jgi:hypothetical protein